MRALLVDFDGLVIDSETSDYEAWRFVYERHGVELPRDEWVARIGGDGSGFDPLARLIQGAAVAPDPDALQVARRRRRDELLYALRPLPGVVDWLESARELGLAVALVSSSPHEWIDPLLRNVELRDHFDAVFTRDQVRRVKPDPELYGVALDALGLEPGQALALEDSPNGLAAAVASGVPCVAVPGPMTRGLDFSAAELCLESLDERALPDVLELLASR